MADLTDAQAASTVKLIGADSSGAETNYLDATTYGLKVDNSKNYTASTALTPGQSLTIDVKNNKTVHIYATFSGGVEGVDSFLKVEGSFDDVTYPLYSNLMYDGNYEGVGTSNPILLSGAYSSPTDAFKKIRVTNVHASATVTVILATSNQQTIKGIVGRTYSSILNTSYGANVLFSAPGSDTGQGALAVRVISSLASGSSSGGGPIVDGSNATIKATVTGALALKVDGSAVTQPISGTVAVSNSFALDATLTGGTQKSRLLDGSGTALTSTLISAKQSLDVNIANTSLAVTGPLTDTQLRASNVGVTVSNSFALNSTLTGGSQLTKIIDAAGNTITGTNFGSGNGLNVNVINTPTVTATGLPSAIGAQTIAASTAVNIASDQRVPIQGFVGMVAVKVDGTATVQPISIAAGAASFSKAEDTSSADADYGVPAMAIRKATPANTSSNDGDYEMLQMSAGRLWTTSTIDSSIPAGSNVIGGVTQSGTWNITNISGTVSLPSGASTESTLNNVYVNLTAMSAKLPGSLGTKTIANSMAVNIASDQIVKTVETDATLFRGRANSFRTPGRASASGQKILSIMNTTGSTVTVTVNKIWVDLYQTVIKAVTVPPPIVRVWKVTAAPTNGTTLTKNKIGGSTTSNASVVILGDASADGTGSTTTLTATLPAGTIITQEFAPRMITAAGYEMADRIEFLGDTNVVLAAGEGLVLFLDGAATSNPTTDMWICGLDWSEA